MSDYEVVIDYTNSSVVKTVWYSKENQNLLVELQDGYAYTYWNVPDTVVEKFKWATSLGEFYNEFIKDEYPYTSD